MAVTVEELLTLPSLKQANVLAGRRGLSKTVSSISVLESANPVDLRNPVFPRVRNTAVRS